MEPVDRDGRGQPQGKPINHQHEQTQGEDDERTSEQFE